MDFTREPTIESVITPKEGSKLVVRSSKGIAHEEFFVDALEIVSFAGSFFYRSLERPKCFLVPVTDYEVIEVRETRMMLKSSGQERGAIKIGGGRAPKAEKADKADKVEKAERADASKQAEAKPTEKRRRSSRRRRRTREEIEADEASAQSTAEEGKAAPTEAQSSDNESVDVVSPNLTSLLPPPQTLIKDTISRYKEDDSFKEAFFEAVEHLGDEEQSKPEKEAAVDPVAKEATPSVEQAQTEPEPAQVEVEPEQAQTEAAPDPFERVWQQSAASKDKNQTEGGDDQPPFGEGAGSESEASWPPQSSSSESSDVIEDCAAIATDGSSPDTGSNKEEVPQ